MGSKRRTEKDFSIVQLREPYRSMLDSILSPAMQTMAAKIQYLIATAYEQECAKEAGHATQKVEE